MLASLRHVFTMRHMYDKEPKALTRISLDTLQAGQILEFTTTDKNDPRAHTPFLNKEEEIWTYLFYVTEPGKWPKGNLWAISPSGEISEQLQTSFHGCGRWTTQKQNPVQKQTGLGFTPVWGELVVDCYPTFDNPDAPRGDRITLNGTVKQFAVTDAAFYSPIN